MKQAPLYHVGQRLHLMADRRFSTRPGGDCTVLALPPNERGTQTYRIRCEHERSERVVSETDLSPQFPVPSVE